MIRDYQAISKTRFLNGNQRIIPTTGKHWGVKLLGILDYETGHVICSEEENYDVHVFHRYLKKVFDFYPVGKIVMVLDNSRIHCAKLLQPFLEENSKGIKIAVRGFIEYVNNVYSTLLVLSKNKQKPHLQVHS